MYKWNNSSNSLNLFLNVGDMIDNEPLNTLGTGDLLITIDLIFIFCVDVNKFLTLGE